MLRTSLAIAAMVLLSTLTGNYAVADNPQAAPKPEPPVADAVRGGWVADIDGVRHIFIFKVLEGAVTGIYCDADCSDPTHLSLVEHGVLTADGVRFQIHRLDGKAPERIDVVGRISGGQLLLTAGARAEVSGGAARWTLHRDPRKPASPTLEEMLARRGIKSGPLVISVSPNPYTPPGPNEALTPAAVEGVWVYGFGPAKQNFIFRRVGEQLFGVVCGPCDNPYAFGAIDHIAIHGETLTFDINHQDSGIGIEYGPFANHASATVSHHEMHLHSVARNGPHTVEGDMVLIGPLNQRTDREIK